MTSGFGVIIAIVELFLYCSLVACIGYLLNRFFPPFKKLVNFLVNADK
jgi:hypothetical protein